VADSPAFALVCDHLERATNLARPAARGTVRLALKEAGLDPDAVSPAQMMVVTERVLPAELRALRIADVEGHCHSIRARLKRLHSVPAGDADSPEAVFARLAQRS
jgi:hypothetical protein